jgi:hypothetical protein
VLHEHRQDYYRILTPLGFVNRRGERQRDFVEVGIVILPSQLRIRPETEGNPPMEQSDLPVYLLSGKGVGDFPIAKLGTNFLFFHIDRSDYSQVSVEHFSVVVVLLLQNATLAVSA